MRSMYKKITIGAFLLLLFGGCSIKEVLPPVKTYDLHVDAQVHPFKRSSCSGKVLKVKLLSLNSLASSDNIYYAIGRYYINSYTQSQWLQPPSFQINSSLILALQKSRIFKAVLLDETQSSADVLLEYSIIDFVQQFNKAKTKSYAKVKINFLLIDTHSNRVIASKTFSVKADAPSQNALGGVKAFTDATSKIISEAIAWIDATCNHEKERL